MSIGTSSAITVPLSDGAISISCQHLYWRYNSWWIERMGNGHGHPRAIVIVASGDPLDESTVTSHRLPFDDALRVQHFH